MEQEIRGYIKSIILTLLLFLIGTIGWHKLHTTYMETNSILENMMKVQVSSDVILSDIKQVSDKNISKVNSYYFTLTNNIKDNQEICIKLVDDYYNIYHNDLKIDNNYLKYVIKKDNGTYSEIRSLNMDGTIYYDNLELNNNSTYELKIWVSEDYQNDFNYYGNLVIVYL